MRKQDLEKELEKKEKELNDEEEFCKNSRIIPNKSAGEWNAYDKSIDRRKELNGEISKLKVKIKNLKK